jgi:hypothetical protein
MSLTSIITNLVSLFETDKKSTVTANQAPNSYKKAVYPLINVTKDAKGKYSSSEFQSFALGKMELSNQDLTIEIALAMKNLYKGYNIRPLRSGDFIVSRENTKAIVRVKGLAESVFYKAAEGLTRKDIDALVTEKNHYQCDAAIMVTIPSTPHEIQYYSKFNNVFGMSGYDLMELISHSHSNKQPLAA